MLVDICFQTHQSYFVPPQLKILDIQRIFARLQYVTKPAFRINRYYRASGWFTIAATSPLRSLFSSWCRYMAEVYRLPKHRIYRQQYLFHISFFASLKNCRVRMLCIYYKYGQACSQKAQIFIHHIAVIDTLQTVLWNSHGSAYVIVQTGYHFRALLRQQHQPDRMIFTIRIRRNIHNCSSPIVLYSAPFIWYTERIKLRHQRIKHDRFDGDLSDIPVATNVITVLYFLFCGIAVSIRCYLRRIGNLFTICHRSDRKSLLQFWRYCLHEHRSAQNERFRQNSPYSVRAVDRRTFRIYCIPIGFKNQLCCAGLIMPAVSSVYGLSILRAFYILKAVPVYRVIFLLSPFTVLTHPR